ncbi:MAG: twitching motility protein PilT [Hyphomonadaceae bacterium]|nr:MAG: twitching motility protein PilT [Hyphomonadaceae bacterium]KAF0183531.1 MAG: twitching motility protein PilT [Hyphomonadaceae bacterium]
MKYLLDASIVVPLLIPEENSEKIATIVEALDELLYLDFTRIEASNALWKACRTGRIDSSAASTAQEKLFRVCSQTIAANSYLAGALVLSIHINHPIYDCLYAIAARENGAMLVTCDAKFAAKLDTSICRVQVI